MVPRRLDGAARSVSPLILTEFKPAFPPFRADLLRLTPVPLRRDLFHWIWAPILERQLDKFKTWWNGHRIRKQAVKEMASGHRPREMYNHYDRFDIDQYLHPVSPESVEHYRQVVLPPRRQWYPHAFGVRASTAFYDLGLSQIEVSTAWNVFVLLKRELLRRDRYA